MTNMLPNIPAELHDPQQISFSFVIVTRNNPEELQQTVHSICRELPESSEIVIVDGSDEPFGFECIKNMLGDASAPIVYRLDEKKGVYHAQNIGISCSSGQWIIVINSGDTLEQGARTHLDSIRDSKDDLIVFGQNVVDMYGKLAYACHPTADSVWPHQSVVAHRRVHNKFGLYPESFRFTSEQLFYAQIRNSIKFSIRNEVISVFRLGGLTSGASLARSKEIFVVRRALGAGVLYSTASAFIFPYIRYMLERYQVLAPLVTTLRKLLYPCYRTCQPAKNDTTTK